MFTAADLSVTTLLTLEVSALIKQVPQSVSGAAHLRGLLTECLDFITLPDTVLTKAAFPLRTSWHLLEYLDFFAR